MHSRPSKIVAMVLCCQPVLWMSNAALAQSISQRYEARPRGRSQGLPVGAGSSEEGSDNGSGGVEPGLLKLQGDSLRFNRAALPTGLPPLDQPVDPDTYVIGPGDVLEVNLWGLQNLKLPAVVDLEGRVFVPKIGYLALDGMTLSEARKLLRESVARYYPRLGFEVGLTQPRTFLVQAVGAVPRPGSYPAHAVDRVSTLLLQAGDLAPHASKRRIEIRRRGGTVLAVDLELFQLTGDVRHNPFLRDGDVVVVPYAALTAKASGAVNRPGDYELIDTRDVSELLLLAGGMAPRATRLVPMSIVRRGPDDSQELLQIPFPEGPGLPAVALQRGDSVNVAGFDELQRSVMVVGALAGVVRPDEAASTKRLGFVEGDSVRTLLARVGGVGPLADLEGSYLLRGDASMPLDLKALVMLKDLTADRPIHLGDALVIPFKRRNILVDGAVFNPGLYPYNPRFGVEQYLAMAGGQNRFAQDLAAVRLINSSGETLPYAKDLKVEPGSSLVVPERYFSRSEVVQISIAIASLIISGTALYFAARK